MSEKYLITIIENINDNLESLRQESKEHGKAIAILLDKKPEGISRGFSVGVSTVISSFITGVTMIAVKYLELYK